VGGLSEFGIGIGIGNGIGIGKRMILVEVDMAIELSGIHILLTYTCTYECDHCFVWGSPFQEGTLSLDQIDEVLTQAKELHTVEWIYFEGGEPFLYHPVVVKAVKTAAGAGFKVGLVSNAYWAIEVRDAIEWLRPLEGLIQDLSVSSDLFHQTDEMDRTARNAVEAAEKLGIPVGTISIARPDAEAGSVVGQLPLGESAVQFRGRAAEKLVGDSPLLPWESFAECPCEDFRDPGRVHLDPLGNVHICQGLSLGNVFRTSLKAMCEAYEPEDHPVIGPLLAGGPAELVRRYDVAHEACYADACHLCYEARRALRDRFPDILTPDQMYGVENV
jgi:MoaA/NifB/PqqE/SkfB family radical SAM enzyme